MSYSIQCVHCQAVLKSATPVAAGKKIKCPKCQQVFTAGSLDMEIPATVPSSPAPISAPSSAIDDNEDDEMARAIAKLEAEQNAGKKPAPAKPESVPVIAATSPPAPAPDLAVDENDEMAAAIAKLEAEQNAGKKPVPPITKPAPVVQAVAEEEIPEIDDDLVVPDEPAPSDKKAAKKEKDTSFKKKKSGEDDEIQRPNKKKVRAEEDEVDPRGKKKKSRDEEEDEEDDEEDQEEPRAKKKKRRDEEGDEEDEDDGPLDKKKLKKKAGSPLLLIGLLGGGLLALFACLGCGIGGYFLFLSNPLVGKWQGEVLIVKLEFEFHRGGTGKFTINTPERPGFGGMPNKAEQAIIHFNYKVTGSNPMLLDIEPTKIDTKNTNNMFNRKDGPGRLRVTIEGDTMTLIEHEPRGGIAIPIKLRRVP